MSAFVVDKTHIDALVRAALVKQWGADWSYYHGDTRHVVDYSNADELGAMLWGENYESCGFRYSYAGRVGYYGPESAAALEAEHGEDLPGTYVTEEVAPGVLVEMPQWAEPYKFPGTQRVAFREPVVILKALDCYEYQSCEHDGWNDSQAKAFCAALRRYMISKLPGYEEAPWGL